MKDLSCFKSQRPFIRQIHVHEQAIQYISLFSVKRKLNHDQLYHKMKLIHPLLIFKRQVHVHVHARFLIDHK